MFGRILKQSFRRQRRRKGLAALAVVAGMAVATAMLTLRVSLGDDLNAELRHIGANLIINPAADSLPVTLNGVDLRPAGSGALLNESDLPRIKTIFWTNNIAAFAPVLYTQAQADGQPVTIEGTYFDHPVIVPGAGHAIDTGMVYMAHGWGVEGDWPRDSELQALVGADLARRMDWKIGGAITVSDQGREMALKVTGTVSTGDAQDGEILVPLHVAQGLAGEPGKFRQVLVSAIAKPEDAFARL